MWKWNKRFEKPGLKKYSLTEGGRVNINLENPSPFQVFTETIGLQGLLTLIKIKSERHAEQNERVFFFKKLMNWLNLWALKF